MIWTMPVGAMIFAYNITDARSTVEQAEGNVTARLLLQQNLSTTSITNVHGGSFGVWKTGT
jgi:hypothetical protein